MKVLLRLSILFLFISCIQSNEKDFESSKQAQTVDKLSQIILDPSHWRQVDRFTNATDVELREINSHILDFYDKILKNENNDLTRRLRSAYNSLVIKKNWKVAMEITNQANKQYPTDPYSVFFMGYLYLFVNSDSSHYYFEKAHQMDPGRYVFSYYTAKFYEYEGNYKLAIANIDKAIENSKKKPFFIFLRGQYKMSNGSYEDAYNDMKEIDLDLLNDPELYLARAYCALKLKKYSESLADCDNAIKMDIKEPKIFLIRGLAKWELGDKLGGIADTKIASDRGVPNAQKYFEEMTEKLSKRKNKK